MDTLKQASSMYGAILVLVGTLIVIQLWLVAAALDAVLGRQAGVSLPAAIGSVALFLGNAGLLWYVLGLDRRIRDRERRG